MAWDGSRCTAWSSSVLWGQQEQCFSSLLCAGPAAGHLLGHLFGWGQPCAVHLSALSPYGDPDKSLFEPRKGLSRPQP